MSALTMSSSASTSTPLSSQHGGGGRSTQVQSHLFIDAVLASPAAFGYGTGASVSVVDQHADQQHQASASLLTPDLASLSMSSHRRGSTSSALYAYSSASSSPSLVATASHPTVTTLPAAASHHDLAKVPVPSSPPSGQFLETSDWLTRASVQQNQDQGFGQQQHHQRRHSVHHLPFQYQASSLPSPARPRHDNQATPTPTPTPTPTSIDWIFEQQQQQGQCLADPIATQSQSQTQNQNQQTAAAGSSDAFNFNMPPFFTTLDSASVPSAAAADQHELVHTSVLNPASSAAQAPLPLPVESTQMLLGSGAAHSTEGLLNSLDVSAPMPMPQSQPQGNSFDIDALLAQAAADAHFELAQQQQQQQHQSQSQSQSQSQVLIPVTCVTDPSAFAVQDSVPFALDCHQAAASRKRKRCVGANPGGPSCSSASTSTSSSPDLVAVTWHHQPPPAAPLLASHAHVPVMDPSTAPSMAALTFPIPSPGLATSHTVTDPMVAAHTSPTMMATTVDSSAPGPIPALCKSMPNPTAPAAGAGVIADTVLGRLRVGQRRDYTVSRSPATSPSMRASDMMGEEATRLGACSRRRPSLPTIVEGHTVSARTRMDSGYVPDLDLHPCAHHVHAQHAHHAHHGRWRRTRFAATSARDQVCVRGRWHGACQASQDAQG
ncbi:hypothetical protein BCR44DRAFT_279779 [Catenaria anguillulae PL171]|uniref:Uncharacterized protein n=1 Tax=Catenaria anguillulae PL171 TaxID=765915 RepID=A0A1Y2HSA6_9FUNG|nr:hypothetical protein BCR44DRAFT_279779 [Catenaria anguillulae PL171]